MGLENVKINSWDERRNLLIPGDETTTLDVCIRHFILVCRSAIEKNGSFFVALAGGTTPKAIYEHLCSEPYCSQVEWDKVHLFWGDERNVPSDHPESNYKMAMDAGFGKMPIPQNQIHRMEGEDPIAEHAEAYDKLLKNILKDRPFDLIILGMGNDGHTASLFPQTDGLKQHEKWAVANYIPQKNTWRMTLTFPAINAADNIAIYVIGEAKKMMLQEVLKSEPQIDRYPIQNIGTSSSKALWIIDDSAAAELLSG